MTYQVNRLAVSRQAPVRKRMKRHPIFNTLNFQSKFNSNTILNSNPNSSNTIFNSNPIADSPTNQSQQTLDEINTTIYVQTGGVI